MISLETEAKVAQVFIALGWKKGKVYPSKTNCQVFIQPNKHTMRLFDACSNSNLLKMLGYISTREHCTDIGDFFNDDGLPLIHTIIDTFLSYNQESL